MNKLDYKLLEEFNFSLVSSVAIILFHNKCKSHIDVRITATKTVSDMIKFLIKHKKEDCSRLQGLKSKITIFDEVDNG